MIVDVIAKINIIIKDLLVGTSNKGLNSCLKY
ncbi:hypothetical protein SAMN04487777_1405 [Priestia aryabhattai B8W22]|nr:hypothetical protein SAMN04487777_1405 [Priestia aryabhattai B8W22]